MTLLNFVSIIGIIFFFSKLFPQTKKIAPVFSIALIIVLLFLCGSVGLLQIGARAITVVGLLLLVYCCIDTFVALKSHKILWKRAIEIYLPVGTIIFIVCGVTYYFLSKQAIIFGWDEFFWGQFAKALYHSNAFYGIKDAVFQGHVRYLPGMSLFQYYFFTFKNQFTSGALYFASGVTVLSGICYLVNFAQRKILSISVAVMSGFFIVIALHPFPFVTIIVDGILGIFFGAGLVFIVFERCNVVAATLVLLPIVCSLMLIKEMGLLFSLIITGVFLLKCVLYDIFESRKFRTLLKVVVCIAILFVSPFILRALWMHHLANLNVKLPYHYFSPKNIIATLFHPTNIQAAVIKSFFLEMLTSGFIFLLAVFSVIFCINHAINPDREKHELSKTLLLYFASVAGIIPYTLMLLISYFFMFTLHDELVLASFVRYTDSFLIGIAFLAATSIIAQKNKKVLVAFFVMLTIVFCLIHVRTSLYFTSIFKPKTFALKHTYSGILQKKLKPLLLLAKQHIPADRNVWIISQGSGGLDLMIFRYYLMPRKVNESGEWLEKQGLWAVNFSRKSFSTWLYNGAETKISNESPYYSYLLLVKTNKYFWKKYGSMFQGSIDQNKKYRLFKIHFNENQEATFIKI